MKKYGIEDTTIYTGEAKFIIVSNDLYFAGYSFMGDAEWSSDILDAYYMADLNEAEQIVEDLEAADDPEEQNAQDDPLMEKFQRILDMAVADRDDFGDQWRKVVKEQAIPDLCHRKYLKYQQAQGYLEGMTTAIFAAGYGIQSSVDSTKLTVTK